MRKLSKNKIIIVTDNCQHCPCATLKFDSNSEEDIMYCQTDRSLIMLREGWGAKEIPNWCPFLKESVHKQKIRYNLRVKNIKIDVTKDAKERTNEK